MNDRVYRQGLTIDMEQSSPHTIMFVRFLPSVESTLYIP